MGPLQARMHTRLVEALAPSHLELVNESHLHSGPGTETHFNLVIVAAAFDGKRAVGRHRLVYDALGQELKDGLHALTMRTLTPEEALAQGVVHATSPACRGGSKADAR